MSLLSIPSNLIAICCHSVPLVIQVVVCGLVKFELGLSRRSRLLNHNLGLAQDIVEFILRLRWLAAELLFERLLLGFNGLLSRLDFRIETPNLHVIRSHAMLNLFWCEESLSRLLEGRVKLK